MTLRMEVPTKKMKEQKEKRSLADLVEHGSSMGMQAMLSHEDPAQKGSALVASTVAILKFLIILSLNLCFVNED